MLDGAPEWQLVRLAPLEVHAAEGRLGLQEIESAAAVQLPVENVQLANAAFVPTAEKAASAAETRRRLDGIPPGIKLAPAGARKISLAGFAQRLDPRSRLLTGAGAGAASPIARGPGAGRSMGATSSSRWASSGSSDSSPSSPDRSPRPPQRSSSGSTTMTPWSALDDFTRLVDRSLVLLRHEPAVGVRCVQLESIPSHAAERPAESGELDGQRRRSSRFFAALVPAVVKRAPTGSEEFDRRALLEERDNLRLVLEVKALEDPGGRARGGFGARRVPVELRLLARGAPLPGPAPRPGRLAAGRLASPGFTLLGGQACAGPRPAGGGGAAAARTPRGGREDR